MPGQFRVQLVLDDAGLDADPVLRDIDLDDAVHVARHVHDEAIGERLAVGSGPATSGGKLERAEARVLGRAGDPDKIVRILRKGNRLWLELKNELSVANTRPVGVVRGQIAHEFRVHAAPRGTPHAAASDLVYR